MPKGGKLLSFFLALAIENMQKSSSRHICVCVRVCARRFFSLFQSKWKTDSDKHKFKNGTQEEGKRKTFRRKENCSPLDVHKKERKGRAGIIKKSIHVWFVHKEEEQQEGAENLF